MKWIENIVNKVVQKIEEKINGIVEIQLKAMGDIKKLESMQHNMEASIEEIRHLADFNQTAQKKLNIDAIREAKNIGNELAGFKVNIQKETLRLYDQIERNSQDIATNKQMFEKLESELNHINQDLLISINSINSNQGKDYQKINDRLSVIEEIKNKMDDGIILMTKKQLLNLIEQKIEVFEGNIDNKMSGLMCYVQEKTTQVVTGKSKDVALLKKLAQLEELKDAIDHRRSTEEIVKKRNDFLKKDRTTKVTETLHILNWVIGETNEF